MFGDWNVNTLTHDCLHLHINGYFCLETRPTQSLSLILSLQNIKSSSNQSCFYLLIISNWPRSLHYIKDRFYLLNSNCSFLYSYLTGSVSVQNFVHDDKPEAFPLFPVGLRSLQVAAHRGTVCVSWNLKLMKGLNVLTYITRPNLNI